LNIQNNTDFTLNILEKMNITANVSDCSNNEDTVITNLWVSKSGSDGFATIDIDYNNIEVNSTCNVKFKII